MCALYYTGYSTPVPKIASIDQSAHENDEQQSSRFVEYIVILLVNLSLQYRGVYDALI